MGWDPQQHETRETQRITRFLARVNRYFPAADYFDRYAEVIYEIPFIRMGWDYERLHEVPEPLSEKLLFVLCAQPYGEDFDTRVPAADALGSVLPQELLAEIPRGGFDPRDLHERLDGTPYAALAEYCDWLWGETGSIFLDATDEMQLCDADWSKESFDLFVEDWQVADRILERVTGLQNWLEADPSVRFAKLLDACLDRDLHLQYLRERSLYACELTESGLVQHSPTEASDGPEGAEPLPTRAPG